MSPCKNPGVDCLSRPTEPHTPALLSQPYPSSHRPPRELAQDQTGTQLDPARPLPALLLPILPHRPFSRTCLLPLSTSQPSYPSQLSASLPLPQLPCAPPRVYQPLSFLPLPSCQG